MLNTQYVSILLCATLLLTGCWNYTGANREKAGDEAAKYIAGLNAAGSDAKFVECMEMDTDGDGYVACTIVVDGTPRTIDCAGKALIFENHGCKDYVAKLRVTNTHIDNSTNNSGQRR